MSDEGTDINKHSNRCIFIRFCDGVSDETNEAYLRSLHLKDKDAETIYSNPLSGALTTTDRSVENPVRRFRWRRSLQ